MATTKFKNNVRITGNLQVDGTTTTTGAQTVTNLTIDTGTKTATAVGGAATLNKTSGKITTESLTTAAAAAYTLTITNSAVAAADIVMASVANGTNSAGIPIVGRVTPAAGSVAILIENQHGSGAFNGTLVISFVVFKA